MSFELGNTQSNLSTEKLIPKTDVGNQNKIWQKQRNKKRFLVHSLLMHAPYFVAHKKKEPTKMKSELEKPFLLQNVN